VTTPPDWGDSLRRLVDGVRGAMAEPARAAEGMGHASECRWCPLCQAIAVARGDRPEVSTALADLLTTTAAALRAAAETPAAGSPEAGAEAGGASGTTTDEQTAEPGAELGDPPPEVQRIEIA
jgi:hypothetical protein